jgi:hypothetical protein
MTCEDEYKRWRGKGLEGEGINYFNIYLNTEGKRREKLRISGSVSEIRTRYIPNVGEFKDLQMHQSVCPFLFFVTTLVRQAQVKCRTMVLP